MKKLFLLFIFFPMLTYAETPTVGNDRDIHGCIASAGYSWSEPLDMCIKSWEYYDIDRATFDTGNPRLNTIITRRVDSIEKSFRKDAEELLAELPEMGSGQLMLDIQYNISQIGVITSVGMDVYTYLGGAHGMSNSYSWNYDTRTEKIIPLPRLISRANLGIVAKNIEQYLLKNDAERFLDTVWLQEGLSSKRLLNYSVFTIMTDSIGVPKTITFYFADYQLGPHSIGQPTVTIDATTYQVLSFN